MNILLIGGAGTIHTDTFAFNSSILYLVLRYSDTLVDREVEVEIQVDREVEVEIQVDTEIEVDT